MIEVDPLKAVMRVQSFVQEYTVDDAGHIKFISSETPHVAQFQVLPPHL